MNAILVRYSEIATKSRRVRGRMLHRLASRVEERLLHEGFDASVREIPGRIIVESNRAESAARTLAPVPGVASTSPAIRTDPTIDDAGAASDAIPVEGTFGIDANTGGTHPFSSSDVEQVVGARVQDRTGATVDLDHPDTLIEVDVRQDAAYVFTDRFEGPGGFPVGSQAPLAALVSGGIDSPVAAYSVMCRGSDVVPIYAYNRPIAAEDHLARFEESLDRLSAIHPGKDWYYNRVDMAAVNDRLLDVERGRMVLHRIVLFRIAEQIADRAGLSGIVTGEAIGQKSSQTTANLRVTSESVALPIFRPLLTMTKESITEQARALGTFESATVDAACRTLAPEQPATRLSPEAVDSLRSSVDLDGLVDRAVASTERIEL